jgi:hypothetical protein
MNDMHIVTPWECRALSRALLEMREERTILDIPPLNNMLLAELNRIANILRAQGRTSGNFRVGTKLDATAIYYIACYAIRAGHTDLRKVAKGMARIAGIDAIERLGELAP